MKLRVLVRTITLAVLTLAGSAATASADAGIKFGPTFAKFSSDSLDFKTRTGVHLGAFFGGNRDGVAGVQTEINWLRRNTETEIGAQEIRVDYLQIPVMLRINAGGDTPSGFRVFGVVGPAVDFKIGDEVEGFTLDDGFEGMDVSLVFGGGVEVARISVEGRYEKGLRRINDTFSSVNEIKKQAFSILFGFRFN